MKLVLVQFYQYHEEILAPQIDFLLPDNEVFVAAPPAVLEHDYIKIFNARISRIFFSDKKGNNKKTIYIFKRFLSILLKYIILSRAVKKNHIDLIVFNTLTKSFHFILINLFFKRKDKIHIIHNAQLFITRNSKRRLKTFRKNLFLSVDVYNYYIHNHNDNTFKCDWFFPTLINLAGTGLSDNDIFSEDKINIIVPGSIDNKRRNYEGLFLALKKMEIENPNFQIFLLGKASSEIQRQIIDMKIDHIIKTFSEYIPGKVMLEYTKNADAAAFLIDPCIGGNHLIYNKYKITGTSVLCLTFSLPSIVSDAFDIDEGLKEKAIFYPGSNIENVFNEMLSGKLSKTYLRKLKALPLPPLYLPENQRQHYRALIGV
jgi:hypothetical protein